MSLKIAASDKRAPRGDAPARFSLAARLTFWYATSAFSLVLFATGVLYWALVNNLDRVDDQFLQNEIRLMRTLLGDVKALKKEIEVESEVYVRLLDGDGRLMAEAPGMGQSVTPRDFPLPTEIDQPLNSGVDFRSPEGRLFHVLAARVAASGSSTAYIVQVAADRTHEAAIVAGYRTYLWITLGLALVMCSLGGYQIARRGIRPVREISGTARRIRSTTLDERLVSAGLPTELADLADTFNEMLDRLEDSFSRLSRFSDDIAHELRTPVNNLRGEAEVALSKPRTVEEYRDTLGSCLEECVRLSRMIDSLLLLARTDNPKTHVTRESLDVGRELSALRDYYETPASEAGIALTVTAPQGIMARVNRSLFQRAVGNLVENALAHTPRGGSVSVAAAKQHGSLRVKVSDTGCGIQEEHLAHIFDRFYRVDRARSTNSGGVGLGLSIVKSIAALHGGTVELSSRPGRGTDVVLVFPNELPPDGGVSG